MNYEPDRPEAEILQEYIDAWDYLYEPSRYLARAYRYYLAMPPSRRSLRNAAGPPLPAGQVSEPGMTCRSQLKEAPGFWQNSLVASVSYVVPASILDPADRDVETEPRRFIDYVVTCAMGEDLYYLRQVVRAKVAAIIKERDREIPAAKSWGQRRGSMNGTGRPPTPPSL